MGKVVIRFWQTMSYPGCDRLYPHVSLELPDVQPAAYFSLHPSERFFSADHASNKVQLEYSLVFDEARRSGRAPKIIELNLDDRAIAAAIEVFRQEMEDNGVDWFPYKERFSEGKSGFNAFSTTLLLLAMGGLGAKVARSQISILLNSESAIYRALYVLNLPSSFAGFFHFCSTCNQDISPLDLLRIVQEAQPAASMLAACSMGLIFGFVVNSCLLRALDLAIDNMYATPYVVGGSGFVTAATIYLFNRYIIPDLVSVSTRARTTFVHASYVGVAIHHAASICSEQHIKNAERQVETEQQIKAVEQQAKTIAEEKAKVAAELQTKAIAKEKAKVAAEQQAKAKQHARAAAEEQAKAVLKAEQQQVEDFYEFSRGFNHF